jgi:hypothetical protein
MKFAISVLAAAIVFALVTSDSSVDAGSKKPAAGEPTIIRSKAKTITVPQVEVPDITVQAVLPRVLARPVRTKSVTINRESSRRLFPRLLRRRALGCEIQSSQQ